MTAINRHGHRCCLICDKACAAVLRPVRSPYIDGAYKLYACAACDSQFFDVREHEVSLADLYERQAASEEYRAEVDFRWSPYWHQEVRRLVALHRGPVPSVLDIGCRTGDFLMHWPAEVARVGVESSARAAEIAGGRGVRVVRTPVEEYRPRERFSVVALYAVVEHLVDPVAFLKHLPALVETRGIVAIMAPTHQSLRQRLLTARRRQWEMYAPPLHLNFMSRRQLDGLMQEMGFALLARRYTSGGTFNPFGKVPGLRKIGSRLMWWADAYTPLNRVPVFDHMYSYYEKR